MTYEELTRLPFRFSWHLNMEDEHTSTYVCTDPRYDIAYCDHTIYKHGEPIRTYRHWMVNGKVYKTKKTLIKAIQEL